MNETFGMIFGFLILAGIIIWIVSSCYISAKVDYVLKQFRINVKDFYVLAESGFKVKTNGKKISQWPEDHKIDYIINENASEIISNLMKFNELVIWWAEELPKVKKELYTTINFLESGMFLIGAIFRKRAEEDLNSLINKYNPETIKIRLATYSYYKNGESRYNPTIGGYTNSESSHTNVTFYKELDPSEVLERVQFLAKYNFTITRYHYDCKNQRSLMTKELRNKIIKRDGRICQHCGKECDYADIEIDHIKPISKGGKTIESNLQVLCTKCNRKKSNKWLDLFVVY